MSFIYRDRKDDYFDYGSTFCPYAQLCISHECLSCHDFDKKKIDDSFLKMEDVYNGL